MPTFEEQLSSICSQYNANYRELFQAPLVRQISVLEDDILLKSELELDERPAVRHLQEILKNIEQLQMAMRSINLQLPVEFMR